MKWEYKVIGCHGDSNAEELLNAVGNIGWELVSVAYYGNGYHLFLKRPSRRNSGE